MIQIVGTYKQLWGWSEASLLYSAKGMKSPSGSYFGYCNPISCLNVSHLNMHYAGIVFNRIIRQGDISQDCYNVFY
ncbi:hypothetical protein B9T16_25945 [Arthrospira sp. PCC 8006]